MGVSILLLPFLFWANFIVSAHGYAIMDNKLNFDWWNSLSKHEQESYLDQHKKSVYRKYVKTKDSQRKDSGRGTRSEKSDTGNKKVPILDVNYNNAVDDEVRKSIEDTPHTGIKKHVHRLKNHVKKFHEDQKKFFKEKAFKPDSEARQTAGDIIRRKAKGIAAKFKEEMHEDMHAYKSAAQAMRKLLSGDKVSSEDKKALKRAATKVAILAGTTLLTGGGGAFVHGVGLGTVHFGAHALAHRLVEAGIVSGAASAIYASAMFEFSSVNLPKEELDSMSDDDIMEFMVKMMGDGIKNAPIKTKTWVKAFKKHNDRETQVKASLLYEISMAEVN